MGFSYLAAANNYTPLVCLAVAVVVFAVVAYLCSSGCWDACAIYSVLASLSSKFTFAKSCGDALFGLGSFALFGCCAAFVGLSVAIVVFLVVTGFWCWAGSSDAGTESAVLAGLGSGLAFAFGWAAGLGVAVIAKRAGGGVILKFAADVVLECCGLAVAGRNVGVGFGG